MIMIIWEEINLKGGMGKNYLRKLVNRKHGIPNYLREEFLVTK